MNRQWHHKLRYCKRHQARKISCLIKVTDSLWTPWSWTFPSASSFPAVQSVERWLNSCVVLRFCGQVAHLIQIWLSLPFHWDSTALLVALKRKRLIYSFALWHKWTITKEVKYRFFLYFYFIYLQLATKKTTLHHFLLSSRHRTVVSWTQ